MPVVFKFVKLVTAVESKAIVPEPVIVPPVIGEVVAIDVTVPLLVAAKFKVVLPA